MSELTPGPQSYGVAFVDGEDFHGTIRIPLPTQKKCEDCGALHFNRYKCDDCLIDQALCDGLLVPPGKDPYTWGNRAANLRNSEHG